MIVDDLPTLTGADQVSFPLCGRDQPRNGPHQRTKDLQVGRGHRLQSFTGQVSKLFWTSCTPFVDHYLAMFCTILSLFGNNLPVRSQYFLLTPKLLANMLDECDASGMTVLTIYNGLGMVNHKEWNLKKFIKRRRNIEG